ncbi:MAG: DegT/DnrJ/EryC1/StrS family aminotransferase [Gammaproteobacteria bacterium]|nr:DegT/DnrJ/EryC1/StrS family aminotransferase [Gammaproteobacteria bacterium]
MKFIDLQAQYARIEQQVGERIQRVLQHGQFILGPEVQELEERLAGYVGVRHCIGVSSGTDALLVAMMALGIGRGDEVITTPFTFIATGEMIALLGATPVFVDIEAETYNIDPRKIEAAITPGTKAIMPVSLYGQCADFDSINALAQSYGIPVIEDAAQSLGASYRGRASCSLSEIGCTSFFPSKPLGGYGDGGACFTDDDDLAQRIRELCNHGQSERYYHPRIGLNARLDTLQAAVLLAKLELFPGEVAARQRIGARYSEMIGERGLALTTPVVREGNTCVYAQYTLASDQRPQLLEQLQANGIPTAVHYPRPLHQQPALATDAFDLRVAERMSERVFSLPMHPYLSETDQQRIVDALATGLA